MKGARAMQPGEVDSDGIYRPSDADRDPDDEAALHAQDWSDLRDPDSTDDEEPG